jgi:hypothetical protein
VSSPRLLVPATAPVSTPTLCIVSTHEIPLYEGPEPWSLFVGRVQVGEIVVLLPAFHDVWSSVAILSSRWGVRWTPSHLVPESLDRVA